MFSRILHSFWWGVWSSAFQRECCIEFIHLFRPLQHLPTPHNKVTHISYSPSPAIINLWSPLTLADAALSLSHVWLVEEEAEELKRRTSWSWRSSPQPFPRCGC